MSASNVKKFMAKVEEKKSLQAKLKAMYNKTMEEGKAKVAAGVVKIAAAEGFKFTVKDLAKAHGAEGEEVARRACWRMLPGRSFVLTINFIA